MSVRIVTYNLLVPIFAEEPGYYVKSRPEYLRTEYRWKLIRSQLEQEIRSHKNTIICLQEVSQTLLPKLGSFFHRMNYTLFDSLYGDRFNDYMGVGLAVPKSMQLMSKNFIKIGDYLRSNIYSFQKDSSLFTWWNAVKDLTMGNFKKPATDPWEIAMSKNNTLICLGVMLQGRPLFIGTYHMPALFKMVDVMIIHSSAVKDLMFQLAAGHSFILAGDFNLKPSDIPYRAITEIGYTQNILLPKVGTYDVSYRFNTRQLLRSAYREKNGTEPNYTNFSTVKTSPKFCATLDYIFFAGNLTVNDVLKLPDHPTGKSYPDKTHPSDHLMLAASFRLF